MTGFSKVGKFRVMCRAIITSDKIAESMQSLIDMGMDGKLPMDEHLFLDLTARDLFSIDGFYTSEKILGMIATAVGVNAMRTVAVEVLSIPNRPKDLQIVGDKMAGDYVQEEEKKAVAIVSKRCLAKYGQPTAIDEAKIENLWNRYEGGTN